MNQLKKIQKELKAPKNQFNKFGNYYYRSCEDILEAVKPLLGSAILTIYDELIYIGSRYYIHATATIKDGDDQISVSAYAREAESKKGMDAAQITGSASSYARKYALNGLFLIDDAKDDDSRKPSDAEQQTQGQKAKDSGEKPTEKQVKMIFQQGADNNLTKEETTQIVEWYRAGNRLTKKEASELISRMMEDFDSLIDEFMSAQNENPEQDTPAW